GQITEPWSRHEWTVSTEGDAITSGLRPRFPGRCIGTARFRFRRYAPLVPAADARRAFVDEPLHSLAVEGLGRVDVALLHLGLAYVVFFGTNARKRRGLSTRILWIVASLTPASRSFGANTVKTFAYPAPPFCFRSRSDVPSADKRMRSSYPASRSDSVIFTWSSVRARAPVR